MTREDRNQALLKVLRNHWPHQNRVKLGIFIDGPNPALTAALNYGYKEGLFSPVLIGSDEAIDSFEHSMPGTRDPRMIIGNTWDTLAKGIEVKLESGELQALLIPETMATEYLPKMMKLSDNKYFGNDLAGFAVFYPELINRPMMIGDVIYHGEPDKTTLVNVVKKGALIAGKFGIEIPKVAILAAVEVANPGLPITMLGQEVAEAFTENNSIHVQGPLSMDLSVSEHAAKKKKAKGEVPGKADILIGPNLTISQSVCQALQTHCDEDSGTILTGGHIPVALPSNHENGTTLLSATLAAFLA